MTEQTGVAIVGCGNIAGGYAKDLAVYPEIDLVGCFDIDRGKAQALADEYGGHVYESLESLLDDDEVEIVVNLTIHHAHYDVTRQCLEAGKHVHSEKPLALTLEEGRRLVDFAKEEGVRLGCSPFNHLGEAQQTAWKEVRDGYTGPVRIVYAEVNHGRIETWHPNPAPFYEVGPWYDVGVYPLTLLTSMFGPVRSVQATGKVLYPDRVTTGGMNFHIDTPDSVIAMVELADGPIARLSVNFYVCTTRQKGLEFHGDEGTVHVGCFQDCAAAVTRARPGEEFENVELLKPRTEHGVEWGRGIRDLAAAIKEDRPHRATGEHALHVLDVLETAMRSSEIGQRIEITSDFPRPTPMEWGR